MPHSIYHINHPTTLIIHCLISLSILLLIQIVFILVYSLALYHQKYPVVYMFNHDLFNFGHELTITNIIENAIDNQIIVVILASGTLYDYALYNAFLLQDA